MRLMAIDVGVTAALFISSCIIIDITVEVEQRIDTMSKSRTRLSAHVSRIKMNTVNTVEYERVTNRTRRIPHIH